MAQSILVANRANHVRNKQVNRPRKRTSVGYSEKKKKHSGQTQPPVLVRSKSTESAYTVRRGGRRLKRRFDVALSSPGAEIRLPSLPQVHLGWRLVSGMMVTVLLFSLFMFISSPMYRANEIRVNGIQRLTVGDISGVAGIIGRAVFEIDPTIVSSDLAEAFPELSAVSIVVTLPNVVEVTVVERQPVLTWKQDEQTLWVDPSGVAFPPRGEINPEVIVEARATPTFIGQESGESEIKPSTQFLPPEFVSAILALDAHKPKESPLVFTRDHGLGWKDKRGWDVYFGMQIEDLEMKIKIYDVIRKQLIREKIKPEYVSVEYVHAPFYRLEH